METKPINTAEKSDLPNFWIRLVAHLIDRAIISIPLSLILFLTLDLSYRFVRVTVAILIVMIWFYYALLEGSKNGATVGKLIMRIKVTNIQSARMSFSIATLRFFSKLLLSDVLLIGYLFVFITEKRQALHDIIAGTLVVKRK